MNLRNNKILFGISLLIIGFLSLLRYFEVVSFSTGQIFGIAFILYSVPTVYYSLDSGRREKLVLATIAFCVGVVFIVESYFEILDSRGIVFASILFIGGAVLFLLFIENSKEKIFLLSSLVLALLSYLSVTVFKDYGLFELANKIGNIFELFWPVLLLVFGSSIFLNRKNYF